MKNEALEDLWRLLNKADIEGKGLPPSVVKEILQKLADVDDEACDRGYDAGYNDGHRTGCREGAYDNTP